MLQCPAHLNKQYNIINNFEKDYITIIMMLFLCRSNFRVHTNKLNIIIIKL